MVVNDVLIMAGFILGVTSLAIAYGLGVQAQRLPFTADIGLSKRQWQWLRRWVKLALAIGVILPIGLLVWAWGQPDAVHFWGGYLLVIAVQLTSERVCSQWLVPSVVVPIGWFYTALRLWQLRDGWTHLALSGWPLVGFMGVVLFWTANLAMLMTIAIPKVYQPQPRQE